MMAQALGIYRNLIGNNYQNGLPQISRTDFSKDTKDEAHSEQIESHDTTAASVSPNEPRKPVFSLQSSKRED